jgi:nucleoside-diphosphate-sugar epimerase
MLPSDPLIDRSFSENAKRDLGFHAEIPHEEGLRSVVEWRRSDERRAVPEQA